MEQKHFSLTLTRLEKYLFQIDFGEFGNVLADEPPPLGDGEGPSPSALLAASVANCLSASLLYALARKKEDPGEMRAEVTGTIERVGKFLRVTRVKVVLSLGVAASSLPSLAAALEVFEDYCTVTQSVRAGVAVDIEICDSTGALLHQHLDSAP